MTSTPRIVFHVHLVQDVATLQPVMRLARSLPGARTEVLVSADMKRLDPTGIWRAELDRICADLDVPSATYESEFEAHVLLQGQRGLIIAGSESSLPNHAVTHRLFRSVPGAFTTVTLQHGFECVGFLHNRAHDATAGQVVRFAADIIVGWFSADRLTSVAASERGKLYVAGPQVMIEYATPGQKMKASARDCERADFEGMVCENLHSVRFRSQGMRTNFMQEFEAFAERIRAMGSRVHFRSHPAGQYTEKAGTPLGESVVRSAAPLYHLKLSDFAYAISAPSSILFDFVLAGVPVAVWSDGSDRIDIRNFSNLARVRTAEQWWRFAIQAALDPQKFVTRQNRLLRGLGIPSDVYRRYANLLSMA